MKKNTIKAFTLVEMLIVIVIIGILIASLMPRMQSAQGRARDVARKNDLAQIQTAIITSQQDKRNWPGMVGTVTGADDGIAIKKIETMLQDAGMTQIPTDPNGSNKFKGLGTTTNEIGSGQYGYMVTTRNSVANGGFVLMAKTEVEGSSNWIVCNSGATGLSGGRIAKGQDLKDVVLCTSFVKTGSATGCGKSGAVCTYYDDAELRYILVY